VQALLLIFGIQAAWKKKLMFASVFLSRVLLVLLLYPPFPPSFS
jgi:hypothetical protein